MEFFQRRRLAGAKATLKRSANLAIGGRFDGALLVLNNVVQRHSDATDSALRSSVAAGLYSMALTLKRLGRTVECHQVLRELDARFGCDGEPAILGLVAQGL